MTKRFVQLGDTHIKDNWTGKEFYAPSETELLELLNDLNDENKEFKVLLDEMSDCNKEIWLDDGRIYRLRKYLKENGIGED